MRTQRTTRGLFGAIFVICVTVGLAGCGSSTVGVNEIASECPSFRVCELDCCDPDETCQEGRCVDASAACEHDSDCSPDETCEAGQCIDADVACQHDSDCSPSETCEANQCVDAVVACEHDSDCSPDEICETGQCVDAGVACEHESECLPDEICDMALGRCIEQPDVECVYVPDFEDFDPRVELAWHDDEQTPEPAYNQVMMTPAVIDINEDGIPDVLFSTFTGSAYNQESILRAFDGRTKEPLLNLVDPEKRVSGSGSLAVGDIDGDGRNEIVAVKPAASGQSAKGLIALDDYTTGWQRLWATDDFPAGWDGAALVDLDADGTVEVVASNRVFTGQNGELKCIAELEDSLHNAIPLDLDGDGRLEVVAGNGAFRFEPDGAGGFDCPVLWEAPALSYPAAGDFGTFGEERQIGVADGLPEVVLATPSANTVALLDGQSGEPIWTTTVPSTGHPYFSDAECSQHPGIGPPTVADFDGDGDPEIGSAGACYYVVIDTDGTLLWKHPSQDFSSRVTGSSVFDFEGDGRAEVVYADECFIRVYEGAGNGDETTSVLFERAHSSGTTRELPVIADVDADYHAEIVLISNDYSSVGTRCREHWPEYDALGGEERGVLIIEDSRNEWVSTRPIWNQHAYYVTNVCDGVDDTLCPGRINTAGAIPTGELANVSLDYLNNFRQNVQGHGLFNAPDLLITDLNASCFVRRLELQLTVANHGARTVLPGAAVSLWAETESAPELLEVLTTATELRPGQNENFALVIELPDALETQDFSLRAVADVDADGAELHHECNENNNAASVPINCEIPQ